MKRLLWTTAIIVLTVVGCRKLKPQGPELTARPSPFGVVLSPNRNAPGGQYERAVQMIKDLGIRWVRVHTEWRQVQPSRKTYRWEKYDSVVQALTDAGINILYQISGTPRWASATTRTGKVQIGGKIKRLDSPPLIDDLIQFQTALMNRYKDRVRFWQWYNEPSNIKGQIKPSRLAQIMKAVYPRAKELDPDCKIVLAGLGGNNAECLPYLREFLQADGGKYCDIIDFHCYNFISRISHQIPVRMKLIRSFGLNKPVWIVETGDASDFTPKLTRKKVSSAPEALGPWDRPLTPLTEDIQAQRLIKRMVLALSVGVQRVFWFCFRGRGDIHYKEGLMRSKTKGLVRADFSPKPSYFAYKTLIAKLDQANYINKLPAPELVEAHLFSQGKHRILVAWVWEGKQTLSLRASSTVSLSDKLGKMLEKIEPIEGKVSFELTDDPIYAEWDE